jgi:hypothetical protein
MMIASKKGSNFRFVCMPNVPLHGFAWTIAQIRFLNNEQDTVRDRVDFSPMRTLMLRRPSRQP